MFHIHTSGTGDVTADLAWSADGESAGDNFGIAVAGAGDVNGDGYSDIVVGAAGYSNVQGKAYVFYGSASGIAGTGASPAWSAEGQIAGDYFGVSVAAAGDVNGDGYGDIVVGASGHDRATGKAYVFQGGATGVSGITARPVWSAVGEAEGDGLGGSVSGAGDVNRDGYGDIVIGAAGYNSGAGKVYIVHGFTPMLTVTTIGSGTVTSDPAGINCGTACSADITFGTQVTLTATAGAGYRLASWGGACSGTHRCVVTLDESKSISAYFVIYRPHVYLPAVRKP